MDNIDIIKSNEEEIERVTNIPIGEAVQIGLPINEDITKHMLVRKKNCFRIQHQL